jgi:hypothetical protein
MKLLLLAIGTVVGITAYAMSAFAIGGLVERVLLQLGFGESLRMWKCESKERPAIHCLPSDGSLTM